jgi:hypothetical protein
VSFDAEIRKTVMAPRAIDPAPADGLVYFVGAEGSEPIKIGVTDDVPARLQAMQTGCPRRLYCIVAVSGGRALETWLHRALAPIRLHGEWFAPRAELMALIELFVLTTAGLELQ